jgi:alanine racemase
MDAKHSLGEPRVLISRGALLHNARLIRRTLGASPAVKGADSDGGTPRICAIVKADAYGHGAAVVADALCNFADGSFGAAGPAVDALAVATIDEAADLPDVGGVPVIVFRPVENAYLGRQRQKLEEAIRAGWVLTVCSAPAADDLARLAVACGRRAQVQLMVDTGMTRSGCCPHDLAGLLHRVDARPSLRLVGLCTHFSNAEEPGSPHTLEQFRRFRAHTDAYAAAASSRVLRHAANSGAVFFAPQTRLDMVRPGISLYGVDPTGRPNVDRNLRPVLRWTAPLVGIRDVRAGTAVGYGQTWAAPRDTRIGLIPVGYADGYARSFSNKGVVMLAGRPAPVVGRVSMDSITVDLADHPGAALGDEVTLLDNDPLSPASVYKLAEWDDTIPYEILCRIGKRVGRVAIDPEEPAQSLRTAGAGDAA